MFDQTSREQIQALIDFIVDGASPWRDVPHPKINHRRASSPFAPYFVGVMQDKGIPDFVVGICTTSLIPPVMRWRDMYSIYILIRQYIAYMHMYLVY
jgi:hypothetical protein